MPSDNKPPSEKRPPEYKPLKTCLKMSISPGFIFGILLYVAEGSHQSANQTQGIAKEKENKKQQQQMNFFN